MFYVYVFLLLGIYIYSLMMILDHFFQIRQSALLFFMVIAIFLLTYSNMWFIPVKDWLQYGVAGQGSPRPAGTGVLRPQADRLVHPADLSADCRGAS